MVALPRGCAWQPRQQPWLMHPAITLTEFFYVSLTFHTFLVQFLPLLMPRYKIQWLSLFSVVFQGAGIMPGI